MLSQEDQGPVTPGIVFVWRWHGVCSMGVICSMCWEISLGVTDKVSPKCATSKEVKALGWLLNGLQVSILSRSPSVDWVRIGVFESLFLEQKQHKPLALRSSLGQVVCVLNSHTQDHGFLFCPELSFLGGTLSKRRPCSKKSRAGQAGVIGDIVDIHQGARSEKASPLENKALCCGTNYSASNHPFLVSVRNVTCSFL